MDAIYYLAIVIFSGLIMARLVSLLKLPDVTGYLLAGIIIGPSVLKLIPADMVSNLNIVTEVALGFIAYGIGSEFNYKQLKKVGKGVILITVFEASFAVLAVDLIMVFVFKKPVYYSIVLGAIAAATAPAATLMVIRQYKAKGPVVNTLLPIVAMDDAVGIIIFGISMSISRSLMNPDKHIYLAKSLIMPIWEIILALLIGLAIGILLSFISKKAKGRDELLCITLATILVAVGLAKYFNVSSLLVCMMIGAVVANLIRGTQGVLSVLDRFSPPIFIAFFTIAGAGLELGVLGSIGLMGLGYVLIRVAGKFAGSYVGSSLAHMPSTVKKYLGFTLIPQAGVAIGLALIAEHTMPELGHSIRAIILAATVIYELVGPVITKIALKKAGEIQQS